MCLTIKEKSKLNKAKKNIRVYKIVRLLKTPAVEVKLMCSALYHCFYYEFKKTYKTPLKRECHHVSTTDVGYVNYRVLDGFHSFKSKHTAFEFANNRKKLEVVVECIIPKGALYYIGEWEGWRVKNYASNQIRINKKIHE